MSDTYESAPSIRSGTIKFAVNDSELIKETEKDGRQERTNLVDIASVRLMLVRGMGTCIIKTGGGKKIGFTSRHCKGFGDVEDRSEAYKSFLTTFHRKLKGCGADPELVAGNNWGVVFGLVALLTGAGLILLTPVSLVVDDFKLRFLLAVVAGVVLLRNGLSLVRGRACPYSLDELPQQFMPGEG